MKASLRSLDSFREDGDRARRVESQIRQLRPELLLEDEIRSALEGYQRRARNAQALAAAIPGRIEVAEFESPTSVLGWVARRGDSPIHIHFGLLDEADSSRARRTAFHEWTHLKTPRNLDLDERWRASLEPLFSHLGLPVEAWENGLDTPFIEGYVEGKTIAQFGRDPKVLYTNREVPFVEKLERLGQERLNLSFRQLFLSNQVSKFRHALWTLCQMMQGVGDA